jgi:autotransporter-associated beta strand protein
MSQATFRKTALTRLAAFCLGTSALTVAAMLPATANSFSVGGGNITATQTDTSSDFTGTGGPFALQANSTTAGDLITVTGVNITNTSNTPNGRALDVGGLLASSGSYSVVMHGSTLVGATGAGAWFQSVGGLVSFDSTGGANNTISGAQGLVVANNTSNGSVSIKTGADTITGSSGEVIYGVAQGTGTISIDTVGATLTGGGLYGISAEGGNGNITLGGLNGGIASTINVAGGSGIYTSSNGNQSITLASSGVINALNGMTIQGKTVFIDSFGTINATDNAIAALNGTGPVLTVTLESGSVTKGVVLGGISTNTFNVVAGANITNATFNGGVGTANLNLTGNGNGAFVLSTASNINGFQMAGSGIWTLTASPTGSSSFTVTSGTLRLGAGVGQLSGNAVIINGGTFDVNGQSETVGALSGTGGAITLGSGSLTANSSANASLAAIISGSGSLIKVASGTLTLTGANTYTGGTVVNFGTLQLGAGGSLASTGALTISGGTFDLNGQTQTVGALSGAGGAITLGSGSLSTNSRANTNLAAIVSGSGSLTKAGSGTLTLTSTNTYTGGTTVSGGTLQVGNGITGSISGNVVDGGTLAFNLPNAVTFAGIVSGSGVLVQQGGSTLTLTGSNTYTGGTTISSGTLRIGNGGTTGSIASNVSDNATMIFNRSDAVSFGGLINGTGSVSQAGAGTLILTGANTYTGGTTISSGTLQIGNGGTTGSVAGNIINNAALAFNRSDNIVFSNVISGTGAATNLGAGTLTLSSTDTYTGATTVSAGTLNITGSIASSAVTVQSGATLSGTGKIGTATIASGGTLTPGSSTTPGTLSVSGNLTLVSGSNYLDAVTPTAAGLTSVSGAANINGNVIASTSAGNYTAGQRYTLLAATGGVSGAFSSLSTPGLTGNLRGQLSYDANDVYLNITPNALSPLLTNATANQHRVVTAIDAAVAGGATPSGGFLTLYGLSGAALNGAIDQISGQIGPNVSNAVGESFLTFLSMTSQGGGGDIASFAPGSAYGAADAPHRAQLGAGETRVWGGVYGGHVGLSADAASGAASVSSSNVGLIGGADMQLADGLLAGVTLGLGRQLFNSGNGSGDSNDFMLGLYGRANAGQAYFTASLGYGWHQITTLRVLTVSGSDVLQGKQNADDFGGRIEAGWRMALDDGYGVAPYGALAGERFESPAYAETAISGASTFALSYAAHSNGLGRSELGTHLDHDYDLENGELTADLRAAWAHQLDDLPFTQASFQSLPGAAFQVVGVRPDRDTALLGANLQVQNRSGLFFGVKGEGQFGAGTTLLEGMGNFGWRW